MRWASKLFSSFLSQSLKINVKSENWPKASKSEDNEILQFVLMISFNNFPRRLFLTLAGVNFIDRIQTLQEALSSNSTWNEFYFLIFP